MAEVTANTQQTVPTISSSNVKLDESGTLSGPSMSGDFTNVPLVDDDKLAKGQKKKRVPRRIIHFTSGETMEEYSTDDEEEEEKPKIDKKQLKWMQWLWYHFVLAGTKSLKVADFCGEKFAWMLGITSPKYQYAIDELERIQREEEEETARDEREQEAIRAREAAQIAELEGGGVDSVYQPNIGQANPAYEITEDEEKDMKKSEEDKVADNKEETKKF